MSAIAVVEGFRVEECAVDSAAYRALLALRYEVLREPLGLDWTHGELGADQGDRHFGGYQGELLVATATVRDLGMRRAKVRQVAVDPGRQGEGIGAALMAVIEERLRDEGFTACELHARKSAAAFYCKIGYEIIGEQFTEIGLPHLRMTKAL